MSILDEIKAHKIQEVAAREAAQPMDSVVKAASVAPPIVRMRDALRQPGTQLIAEVKRRSPSKGNLRPDADAPSLAVSYFKGGAAAVSVLTDERFFNGADSDLREVRANVRGPLLRKDFTISDYQIFEARSLGADAVLLILAMLDDEAVTAFLETANSLGMDAILEVHSVDEVLRAIPTHAPIIGINNRNLANFTEDLGTTERLISLIPSETIVISESGIRCRADVERVEAAGAKAVLVGEALVTSADPIAKVRELLGRA